MGIREPQICYGARLTTLPSTHPYASIPSATTGAACNHAPSESLALYISTVKEALVAGISGLLLRGSLAASVATVALAVGVVIRATV